MKTLSQQLIKFSFLIFSICLFSSTSFGQGINITTGGRIDVSGAARIDITNGNLINNGTFLSAGTDALYMNGSNAALLSGSGSSTMYDLFIVNSAGVTTRLKDLSLHNLNVYSSLVIDTSSAVVVSNYLRNKKNDVASIWLKASPVAPNGTLVFHNCADSFVLGTVEMYSKASKVGTTYRWQFFGVPVESVQASPTFDGSYVRKYNETGSGVGTLATNLWIQQSNSSLLTAFNGYEITQNQARYITFQGKLINRDFPALQLSYTIGSQYPGQHLIGNPYTSAVDIKKLIFGSDDASVIEKIVYIYNTGSFSDWTASGGGGTIAGNSPGQYIAVPVNQAGVAGLPSQISSMQAFLIRVKQNNPNATLSIPYSQSGTNVCNTELQKIQGPGANEGENKVLTMVDVIGNRYSDRAWIFTEENCTNDYDNGWDGYKLIGASVLPRIWSIENSGHYQINSLNDIDSTVLGFIKGEDSIYTIRFTHQNTAFAYPSLYLIDLMNGAVVDVSESGSQFTFNSNPGTSGYGRFLLLRSKPSTTVDKHPFVTGKADAFAYGRNVYVENTTGSTLGCEIFDIHAKLIFERKINDSSLKKLDVSLSEGSYVVRLTANNAEVNRKIVIH